MGKAGQVKIKLLGDVSNLSKGLLSADSKLGKFAGGFAKISAIGVTSMLALGAGAFKLGQDFDAAYDTIRSGSGATGEAFQGLKDDFKATLASVPDDMGKVSSAIADLNTRLNLTGEPLQEMSEQMLDLARVSKEDLSQVIKSTTQSMGDWGVAVEDQSVFLDKLWVASQNTGIGVSELADMMVKTGAPMRNLGFGIEEQAALLGKWNKEGVNTEIIFSGLRAATGKWAKSGKDASKEFQVMLDKIKSAPSLAEATTLAIETFGVKAGPDLADAIRGGRFEIEELTKTIEGSSGAIAENAKDVASFGEKWKEIKNKVLVKIEPVVTKIFTKVGNLLDKIDFSKFEGFITSIKEKFEEFKNSAAFGFITGAIESIVDSFKDLGAIIQENMPLIKDIARIVGGVLLVGFAGVVIGIKIFVKVLGWIIEAAAKVREWILAIGNWIIETKDKFMRGVDRIKEFWDNLVADFKAGVDRIKKFFTEDIPGFVTELKDKLVSGFKTAVQKTRDAFTGGFDRIVSWAKSIPTKIKNAIGNLATTLRAKGTNLIIGLKNAAITKGNEMWAWVRRIPGRIKDAIPNPGKILYGVGKAIINGLVNGLKAGFGKVKDTLGGLTSKMTSWKGPYEYDKVLLKPAGKVIIDGLNAGLSSKFGETKDLLQGFTEDISGNVGANIGVSGSANGSSLTDAAILAGAGNSGRNITINIENINGESGQDIVRQIQEELQRQGL